MATKKSTDGTEALKQLTYLAGALKAPRITEAAARLADHARDAGWTHEEYLAAVLSREVAAREASGAATRVRSAGFPTRKLEDFNFDHQPALNRDMIAHLGTGAFLAKASNVVLLGPQGTGKTHLGIGLWSVSFLAQPEVGTLPASHYGRRSLSNTGWRGLAAPTSVEWCLRGFIRLRWRHNPSTRNRRPQLVSGLLAGVDWISSSWVRFDEGIYEVSCRLP